MIAGHNAWVMTEEGWRHRPWFKVVVNTVLRSFQKPKKPGRKWVMFSRTSDEGSPPTLLGYGFGWITHQ